MKPGRNESCPCGSKLKFKRCCGIVEAAPAKLLSAAADVRGDVGFYQRAVEINPRSSELQNGLGSAYLAMGQFTDALACYQLALKLDPVDAKTYCNLGNVLGHLGRIRESLEQSRKCVELDPTVSAAHNNSGLALAALGDFESAVSCFWKALSLNPRYVDALNNLGNTLLDMGQLQDAMSAYARALEIDPGHATSHRNFGNALLHQRKLDEAAASYRKALVLNPEYAGAHLTLGMVLRQLGRAGDAELECQKALKLQPDSAEALSFFAELQADKGQFAQSREIYERAITLDPTLPQAWLGLAGNRKMSIDDRRWREGIEGLLAQRLPLKYEIGVHYALGKYFDDLSEFENAFEHYRQANELSKLYGRNYDCRAMALRVQQIIERFSAQTMLGTHPDAQDSTRPVFIIGMPRSGTSLAEQIVASHPAVFGAGELTFWDNTSADLDAVQRDDRTHILKVAQLGAAYLEHLVSHSKDALKVIDKMPGNFMNIGLIHTVFPRARFIHMQRHPLDTCLSIYFQYFLNTHVYSHDLADLASFYRQYRLIMDHWRTLLPTGSLLEVPYEGLVENQEDWSRRMIDFVGLPWDGRCLDFHRTDRVVTTASKWQVRQKVHARSKGRWRNYEKFLGPLRDLTDGASAESVFKRDESRTTC